MTTSQHTQSQKSRSATRPSPPRAAALRGPGGEHLSPRKQAKSALWDAVAHLGFDAEFDMVRQFVEHVVPRPDAYGLPELSRWFDTAMDDQGFTGEAAWMHLVGRRHWGCPTTSALQACT